MSNIRTLTLSITYNEKEIDRVQLPMDFIKADLDRAEASAAMKIGVPREQVQSWFVFGVLPEAADSLAETIDAMIEKVIEQAPVQ